MIALIWRPSGSHSQTESMLSLSSKTMEVICGYAVEKMIKTYLNVVNPDDIIRDYGGDTLRVYGCFLAHLSNLNHGIPMVLMVYLDSYVVLMLLLFNQNDELEVTDGNPSREESEDSTYLHNEG